MFKLSNLVYRFFIRNKLNNQNRVWSKTFSTKMKSQKLKTIKIKVEMAKKLDWTYKNAMKRTKLDTLKILLQ